LSLAEVLFQRDGLLEAEGTDGRSGEGDAEVGVEGGGEGEAVEGEGGEVGCWLEGGYEGGEEGEEEEEEHCEGRVVRGVGLWYGGSF
jgi:hypothetical protein